MMENEESYRPMTVESVRRLLEESGAEVMARSGRSEHYGAPREFTFEVKGIFPSGMELHVVARQFNYREAWEGAGRVNDMVDVTLLRDGGFTPLPKGYPFFQGDDTEEGVDEERLQEIVTAVSRVNPKLYLLQRLTGDG